MRNFLVVAMLFCALGHLSAQQIAVPYRDGTKWGLSDRDGKMIVQPQYDSLTPSKTGYSGSSFKVLMTTVGSKKGLVKDGRELLAPVYDWVYLSDDCIRAEKYSGSVISKYLFDTDGNPMFPKPMLNYEIMGRESLYDKGERSSLFVLSGTDENGLESIFTWDSRRKEVAQWIAKDLYSVKMERVRGNSYLLLRKREKQDSPVVFERYAYDNGIFHPAPAQRPLLESGELEALEYEYRKSLGDSGYGTASRGGNGSGSDYYNGDLSIDAPVGDLDYGPVLGTGSGSGRGDYSPEEIKRREDQKAGRIQDISFYKNNDGTLAVIRSINGSQKKIKAKFQPESFTIKNDRHSITVKDTVYNYSNIVVYKYKGRHGIMTSRDIRKEYDTLIGIADSRSYTYMSKGHIAGNRDKKTKKMKYGVLDANGDAKAMIYDAVTVDYKTSTSNKAELLVVKGGKYGLLDQDGNVVIPVENDLITSVKGIEADRFFQVKKGSLYGLHILRSDGEPVTVPPVFGYQVKDVYLNYPNGRYSAKEGNMVLIQLMNPDGTITGYAREDGFLYFKD